MRNCRTGWNSARAEFLFCVCTAGFDAAGFVMAGLGAAGFDAERGFHYNGIFL